MDRSIMCDPYLKREETILPVEKKMRKLPLDLIMEILIWTDIESLVSLTRVCKEWRSLLSRPDFINRHHRKSKNVTGFILDNMSEHKDKAYRSYEIHFFPHPTQQPCSQPLPSLTFMLEPVKIHASTLQGLLLCFGLINQCYYVCKPTTQEWATIPTPNFEKHTVRMVMSVASSSPLRFRIMRICHFPAKLQFQCEIFDSHSNGVWKLLEDVGLLLDGSKYSIPCVYKGVFVNGSFFWLEKKGDYKVSRILYIDLWAEEGRALNLPEEVATEDVSTKLAKRLSNLHGGLGLVRLIQYNIYELWTLVNLEEQRWRKVHVLDMNHGDPFSMRVKWLIDEIIVDNTLLVNRSGFGRQISWYNYKEDKYIQTNENASVVDVTDLHFFKSDYFPCNIKECPYYNAFNS